MSTTTLPIAADDIIETRRSAWQATLHFCRREPLGAFGMLIVIIMVVTGVSAEFIAPYSPTANDFAAMTEPPSWDHWLGTDQFGRDLLSRIIYGARTALIVGLSSALVGGLAGLVLGVASAYFGGPIDLAFQRLFDIVMAFPLIIMALAMVAIFGSGVHNVIIAITIPLIPRCARVVRSSALSIREIPYVDAARACGYSHARIIVRHMVPNVMAPFLIMLTAFVGQAILAEASLSYLGLGVQEPTPAWGLMLQGGAEEVRFDGALDCDLSGTGDRADGVWSQPVRGCSPRCAGSEAAGAVIARSGWGAAPSPSPLPQGEGEDSSCAPAVVSL